jgi:hypothetical protein
VWLTIDVECRAFDVLRDAIPSRDEIEALSVAVLGNHSRKQFLSQT